MNNISRIIAFAILIVFHCGNSAAAIYADRSELNVGEEITIRIVTFGLPVGSKHVLVSPMGVEQITVPKNGEIVRKFRHSEQGKYSYVHYVQFESMPKKAGEVSVKVAAKKGMLQLFSPQLMGILIALGTLVFKDIFENTISRYRTYRVGRNIL